MIKLVILLIVAYLCFRLLRSIGSSGKVARPPGPPAEATPSIDRSQVVDAEYREIEPEPAGPPSAEQPAEPGTRHDS